MTSPAHPSGTDRIGEVLDTLRPQPGFVLNLQGDEPLLSPSAIERLIAELRRDPESIWTLADRIENEEEFERVSVVKVVRAVDGRALYFSRAPVPHRRGGGVASRASNGQAGGAGGPAAERLRHVGVYGYPVPLLRALLAAGPSPLEREEGLEQLRALELGLTIRVVVAPWPDAAIDTPEDLERLRRRYPVPEDSDSESKGRD